MVFRTSDFKKGLKLGVNGFQKHNAGNNWATDTFCLPPGYCARQICSTTSRQDNLATVYSWEKRYYKDDAETSLLIWVLHILEAKLECKTHSEHLPRKSNHIAILANHLSRASTTTHAELDQIKHVEWRTPKGALLHWICNPILDWSIPVKICSEIKD